MLDAAVEAALRELMEGRVCCRCGEPAERIRHGCYFCGRHAQGRYRDYSGVEVREVKDPQLWKRG